MSYLYVCEQGATIGITENRFQVKYKDGMVKSIPAETLEVIEIFGKIQITTQCITECLKRGVNILFYSTKGAYFGRLISTNHVNVQRQRLQAAVTEDEQFKLDFSKRIINAKIRNQIVILRRYARNQEADIQRAVIEMQNMYQKLDMAQSIEQVMGFEGTAAKIYFRELGKLIDPAFAFTGRNRRPPKDPINVLISLGYTFLTKEVSSALDAESFEMYLGFLHGIRYGRKSLPLDIVEEFRQPVIDRFVITLCNKSMINKYDFEQEEERIILNESGFQKFCREYEKYISGAGGINYRSLIRKQVQNLKAAVMEKREYVPYRMEENHVSGEL